MENVRAIHFAHGMGSREISRIPLLLACRRRANNIIFLDRYAKWDMLVSSTAKKRPLN